MSEIVKLTIALSKPNLSVQDRLTQLCKTIKKVVPKADRASIWLFTDYMSEITCLNCIDEASQVTNGQVLKKQDFTPYFDFILNHDVLKANDARENPNTNCFNESYFEPLNIISLLDFIFHTDFKPTGVICCESVGNEVAWTDTDVANLKRISNIASMFIANDIAPYADYPERLNCLLK